VHKAILKFPPYNNPSWERRPVWFVDIVVARENARESVAGRVTMAQDQEREELAAALDCARVAMEQVKNHRICQRGLSTNRTKSLIDWVKRLA
jgi:hypothetical protein